MCVWHTQGWTLESPATRLKRPYWYFKGKSCALPTLAGLQVPSTPAAAAAAAALSYIGRSKSILNCGTLFHSGGGRLHEHLQRVFFSSPPSFFLINHRDTASVSTLRRTEGGMYLNPNIYGWRRPRRSDHATFTGEDAKSPLYGATQRKKRRAGESLACVF